MSSTAWVAEPTSAWMLKLARARSHRGDLNAILGDYRSGDPYSLEPEATDDPQRVAYRLCIHRDMPAEASLVLGDALHNLRSALDALAFELANRHAGRLTDKQAKAVSFPLVATPAKFEEFFRTQGRGALFGEDERAALRSCQSFWVAELSTTFSEREKQQHHRDSFTWSWQNALNHLNNIDKHRRLHLTNWWPDLLYWGSEEGDTTGWAPGREGVGDGAVLGYMVGPSAATAQLQHEFALVVVDDPGHRPDDPPYHPTDCLRMLDSLMQGVAFAFGAVAASLG